MSRVRAPNASGSRERLQLRELLTWKTHAAFRPWSKSRPAPEKKLERYEAARLGRWLPAGTARPAERGGGPGVPAASPEARLT